MSEPLYHVVIEERVTARGWTVLDNLREQALRAWVVEPYDQRKTVETPSVRFSADQIVRIRVYRSDMHLSNVPDVLAATRRIAPGRQLSERELAERCFDVTDQYIAQKR